MSGKYGILIVFGLLLIGASVVGNAVLYAFGVSPFHTERIHKTGSVPADGVSGIEIRTDDGDIRVVAGGGNAITATVEGRTGRKRKEGVVLAVSERDGRVVIEASREVKRRLISITPEAYELLVELPDRMYEQVKIASTASDIKVRDVRAERIAIETLGGEIETAGLSGSIDARTEAGDIELGVRAIAGSIRAETAMGDIEVVTEEAPEKLALDMRTTIGEQTIGLPGTAIVGAGPDVPEVRLRANVGDLAVTLGR
jgi:hypothetical protein